MKQGPPQNKPTPETEPILTFEEFSYRDHVDNVHHYNNFFMYFIAGEWGENRRQSPHYQRFVLENLDMATSLRNKIGKQLDKSKNTSEALKPFDRDLYEAYKIMRGYGFSNKDLFS